MLNISLISSSFWHVKIVHFLCSNFQVFAGIFTRCPTCQRAHIYHFCSFCIRCHICHFPIAIWSQNLGIGTIFEPNLPLKTGCNKFQMESVKMKKATKTVAFRQLAIYCNIVDNQLLTYTKIGNRTYYLPEDVDSIITKVEDRRKEAKWKGREI